MATIKFEQSNPIPGRVLNMASPDLFVMHMNRAFGAFPCELNKDHLERLEGMAATYREQQNPFRELIRAVKALGTIKVWSESEET